MADQAEITEETMDIIIIGCGKRLVRRWRTACPGGLQWVMIDTSAGGLQRVSDDIDAIKLVGNGASISMQIGQVCRRRTC